MEAGSRRLAGQDFTAGVAGLSRPRAGVSTGAIVAGPTATAPGAVVAAAGLRGPPATRAGGRRAPCRRALVSGREGRGRSARAPVVSRCIVGRGDQLKASFRRPWAA